MPSSINGFLSIPVYAFIDFDPDGIGILSTYKHGSLSLAHESTYLSTQGIQWLCMKSSHMRSSESGHQYQSLLRLTERDRRRARCILERLLAKKHEDDWRRELQVMLMLNVKNEIEVLKAKSDYSWQDFAKEEIQYLQQ